MRDIAQKAGVALGGAYYYFASKEAFLLAFYQDIQESSHYSLLQAMERHKKLKDRLRCILEHRLPQLSANRKFAAALFRHSPNPPDPLSPDTEATRPIPDGAVQLFPL